MITLALVSSAVVTVIALALILRLQKERRQYQEWKLHHHENTDQTQDDHRLELQNLLDSFPLPFFSIDPSGAFIRINRSAASYFGDRQILRRKASQIILDEPLLTAISQAIEADEPTTAALRLPPDSPLSRDASGKESHWQVDFVPVAVQRESREIQVLMRDFSEAAHTDQVRQDFVANASHELRTPLSIISGYLETLTEDEGVIEPEMTRRILGTMQRHVERINRIVEDMLVISKLESEDGIPLNVESFLVSTCINDVIERLEPVIEAQEAKIEVKIPEIHLEGDRFYWTQILFNLIENALKQNATIKVQIRVVGEQISDDRLKIEIIDNGLGIPSDDLPFIFKRFFRVEKHHSQNQVKGTGLGLSIVKRAIEAHGGTITARSTPGVETAFTITVPLTQPS